MIDDGGVAGCVEARTDTEVWRERVGGNYSASPVFAEGRIYFLSEEGKTTVIDAGVVIFDFPAADPASPVSSRRIRETIASTRS